MMLVNDYDITKDNQLAAYTGLKCGSNIQAQESEKWIKKCHCTDCDPHSSYRYSVCEGRYLLLVLLLFSTRK